MLTSFWILAQLYIWDWHPTIDYLPFSPSAWMIHGNLTSETVKTSWGPTCPAEPHHGATEINMFPTCCDRVSTRRASLTMLEQALANVMNLGLNCRQVIGPVCFPSNSATFIPLSAFHTWIFPSSEPGEQRHWMCYKRTEATHWFSESCEPLTTCSCLSRPVPC